jgi:hypothetical protein
MESELPPDVLHDTSTVIPHMIQYEYTMRDTINTTAESLPVRVLLPLLALFSACATTFMSTEVHMAAATYFRLGLFECLELHADSAEIRDPSVARRRVLEPPPT